MCTTIVFLWATPSQFKETFNILEFFSGFYLDTRKNRPFYLSENLVKWTTLALDQNYTFIYLFPNATMFEDKLNSKIKNTVKFKPKSVSIKKMSDESPGLHKRMSYHI